MNISVGRSCFVRCVGCYNHFGHSPEPLDTAHVLRFLSVAADAGAVRVTFCGGDPLSRPDILPLLQTTRRLGYRVTLDTVGTPLLGEARTSFYGRKTVSRVDPFQLAALVDCLGIPLDGASNDVMLSFRAGREVLFDEQIRILELLDAAGASACINTVAHRGNISNLEAILPLIAAHPSVRLWQVFQFSATGPHGYRNRARFAVSDDVFSRVAASLRAAVARSGARLRFEPKSNRERHRRYLLVDSDGLAWMPAAGYSEESAERIVLGDIADPADDERLVSILCTDARTAAAGAFASEGLTA